MTALTKVLDFSRHRDTKKYGPARIKNEAQHKHEMEIIFSGLHGVFGGANRRFVTFGSCFAVNVANALTERGKTVTTASITEDVNSTYNNRLLLKKVFLGEDSPFTEQLKVTTAVDYNALCEQFKKSTDIIFTLGNVFHLIGNDGHALLSKNGTTLVRETPQETEDCLWTIIKLLRDHTRAKLFISVSPVPISGYRGDEFRSAIEADCASKCQLLTAVRSLDGFTYIPTFEVFRWLSAHQDFATFGEGTHPRHITRSHIDMAMGILCGKG